MTVRNDINAQLVKGFKWSFSDVIASGVGSTMATILQLGAGMAVSQAGGNLVITTGTTAYSETIIRGREPFDFEGIFRYGLTLSQRIANNNFAIEWVDLFGDNLPMSITNATTVSINKPNHGLTAADVGKGIWIGAISVASCLTQRAVIASVTDDNNFVITVSGFAASGTGTCSLFGFNYHQVIYSGTTATTLGTGYNTQRKGWANTAVNATINTTASGHIGVIESARFSESTYSDAAYGSSAGLQFTPRATMNQNIPDGVELYLQIRAFNGATNPATTTTATLGFIDAQIFNMMPVNVAGLESLSTKNAIPVSINQSLLAGTSGMLVQGLSARNATAANAGGLVLAAAIGASATPAVVTSGRSVEMWADLTGKLLNKPYGPPEQDWQYAAAASGILNTTTAVTFKAAAGASVRNYITAIQITAEALGAATELAIRDGAAGTVIWRTKIPTGGLPTLNIEFPTPLKGTANTLMEVVTLTASVTGAVYFNAQGYIAP